MTTLGIQNYKYKSPILFEDAPKNSHFSKNLNFWFKIVKKISLANIFWILRGRFYLNTGK